MRELADPRCVKDSRSRELSCRKIAQYFPPAPLVLANDLARDFHQLGDGMSLKLFREVMREVYREPLLLMGLPSTLSARKSDAEGMRADLDGSVPEVHSLSVEKLLKTIELAAKKGGIKLLPYEMVEPVSARGSPLSNVPLPPGEAICVQGVHLPFHFCCVVITSEQVRKALSMSDEEKGCVMYLNSLTRRDAPKIRSVESINSPILRDMVEGLSDFVVDLLYHVSNNLKVTLVGWRPLLTHQ